MGLVRVCQGEDDRTWNQGLSGHVTGLGTGQSLSRGSEFNSQSLEFESQSSEFVSIGSEFCQYRSQGVMGHNTLSFLLSGKVTLATLGIMIASLA